MDDILHALGFLLLAGSVFIAFIACEAWWLRRHGRSDAYQLKETLSNMSTGFLYKVVDGIVVALFVTHFYDDVLALGLRWQPESAWLRYTALFFATDLVFWFTHLAMHKLRYGWCSHVTHHSSVRFNLSTALRQNFLFDLSGFAILWWLPLALIGFDKTAVVIAIELNLLYQFFIHTEVVRRLPPWIEFIFNTPSHHRVHHGRNPAQIDTNFGGVLILWDRLFGTFVDEREAGDIAYGITLRQPTTLNPLRLNLDEFAAMWRDVWRWRDLRALWKHPDWAPQQTGQGKRKRPRRALGA